MPPKGPTTKWTVEEKFRLLLTAHMKMEVKVTAGVWAAVAAEMGNGLTANAVSKQFNALKREYMSSPTTSTDASGPATNAAAKPKKRSRGGKAKIDEKMESESSLETDSSEPISKKRKAMNTRGKAPGKDAENGQGMGHGDGSAIKGESDTEN